MSVENNQRRKYDKKFKVEAIRLLKESGKTIKEAAENLGIYHGNYPSRRRSTSWKDNCYDNAYAESLFHTIKTEEVYHSSYRICHEARTRLFAYIEVLFNRERNHSGLGYKTPYQFEQSTELQKVS